MQKYGNCLEFTGEEVRNMFRSLIDAYGPEFLLGGIIETFDEWAAINAKEMDGRIALSTHLHAILAILRAAKAAILEVKEYRHEKMRF